MEYKLPHTIENVVGEKLIFKSITDGDKLIVENFVQPGAGPVMHVHFKQDESLTIKEGRLGYQIKGEEAQYAGLGETVTFLRGIPHRFWNAGEEVLNCEGWIQPANSIVFFLSSLYEAMNKSGSEQPEAFDSAYLMTRYQSEYGLVELPAFVRKFIIPATYLIGKLTGKYHKFKNAPEPL